MKVSQTKLDLTEKIIEDWEQNIYDSKEIMFDLLREFLQKQTISRLKDLYGYENTEEDEDDY